MPRPLREGGTHYERVEPRRVVEYHDPHEFDRVAFAMEALDRLRPRKMTVAVYTSVARMRVEKGRDYRRGEGATWAIVGIPPHASREQIAYALAELAGVESVPYAVQMLLAREQTAYR